jgi:cation:H+ antiporter
MLGDVLLFAVGITCLTVGADWLVRGSSRLATNLGVSHLIIGLTVVAFGTSAPELVVSGSAALAGEPDVATGNVMGSTVANVGLIVGVGAILRPIVVHRSLLVRETPLVIGVLTLVMLLSLDDQLGRWDGIVLVLGFTLYMVFLLKWGGAGLDELAKEVEEEVVFGPSGEAGQELAGSPGAGAPIAAGGLVAAGPPSAEPEAPPGRLRRILTALAVGPRGATGTSWAVLQIAVGLPSLLLGAHWLIGSALSLAEAFQVPEAVIAATMIAVGTSLPELASTVAAAVRGLGDIAIGNVIGSNVFNLGLVLGTASILEPLDLPPRLIVSQVLPALIFSAALIPLALSKERVARTEGVFLLTAYIAFIVLIL